MCDTFIFGAYPDRDYYGAQMDCNGEIKDFAAEEVDDDNLKTVFKHFNITYTQKRNHAWINDSTILFFKILLLKNTRNLVCWPNIVCIMYRANI